jgi:hypothetical protein
VNISDTTTDHLSWFLSIREHPKLRVEPKEQNNNDKIISDCIEHTEEKISLDRRPLTTTIVEDPVIAKTVQRRTISRYQEKVHLGAISFGPKNLCRNELPLFFVELEASLSTVSPSGLPLVKFRRRNEDEASRLTRLT